MALCHSLMFFVVVAINLTPGVSEYSFSVNGKKYAPKSEVFVEEGNMINITCKFSVSNSLITWIKCSVENLPGWMDVSKPPGTRRLTVTSSLEDTKCYCLNDARRPESWITFRIESRPTTYSTASPKPTNNPIQGTETQKYEAGLKTTSITPTVMKTTTKTTPRTRTHSKTSPRPIKKTSQGTTNEQNGAGSEPKTTRPTAATKIREASTSPNNKPSYTSGKPTQKNNQLDVKKQDQVSSELTTTGPTGDRSGRDLKTASNSREANSVQDENNMDLLVIIVPASICVVLVLVVTLVIVVLVLRRKTATRNIQDKGEPTYAVVQDVETKRDYIGTNIDETYAVVNKKQKANKKDVGPQDFNPLDETYAAVNKNKTNKGDTEVSTDPVSNPMAQPKGMNFNMAALREEADGLAVYKKVQKEHGEFSTEDKTQTNSTEGSGRYLNEDGLVYVTVELNPVAPKSTIKPPSIVRDERYEPVEYSTIVPGQGAKKDETNDEG